MKHDIMMSTQAMSPIKVQENSECQIILNLTRIYGIPSFQQTKHKYMYMV